VAAGKETEANYISFHGHIDRHFVRGEGWGKQTILGSQCPRHTAEYGSGDQQIAEWVGHMTFTRGNKADNRLVGRQKNTRGTTGAHNNNTYDKPLQYMTLQSGLCIWKPFDTKDITRLNKTERHGKKYTTQ